MFKSFDSFNKKPVIDACFYYPQRVIHFLIIVIRWNVFEFCKCGLHKLLGLSNYRKNSELCSKS